MRCGRGKEEGVAGKQAERGERNRLVCCAAVGVGGVEGVVC